MPLPQSLPCAASAWLMAEADEVAVDGLVSCCLIWLGLVGAVEAGAGVGMLAVVAAPAGLGVGLALGAGAGLQAHRQQTHSFKTILIKKPEQKQPASSVKSTVFAYSKQQKAHIPAPLTCIP